MISTFAEESPNKRELIYHYGGGVFLGSINFLATSNIEFTQEYAEEWSFYITTTEIILEELYSNNFEGVKFWKLTAAVCGMATAMKIWDGTRPVIYPKYHSKTKAVGIDFAFNFDLPVLNKEKGAKNGRH